MNYEQIIQNHTEPLLKNVPETLAQCIRYSLYGPGKRIRLRLLLTSAELLNLDQNSAQQAAVALEMIHTYTLIHDDLPCMDNDDMRRGKPTAHRAFSESTALLAGDALQTLAFELWSEIKSKNTQYSLQKTAKLLGASGLIGGQALEETLRQKPPSPNDPSKLFQLFQHKTAHLFIIASAFPAWITATNPQQSDALEAWGCQIGLAFQIADDLEDPWDSKTNDPAHLAYYFKNPKTEIIHQTLQKLKTMDQLIKTAFSSQKTDALLEFSNEVSKKLLQ